MRSKRILCLVLALLMLVPLMVACKDEPEAAPPPTVLDLVANGKTEYTIVYDSSVSDGMKAKVQTLVETVKGIIGADISVTPSVKQDTSEVPAEYEILIGKTKREETTEAFKTLRSKDYVIEVVGKKLVIGGPTEDSTMKALDEFISKVVYAQGDRNAVNSGKKLDLTFSSENNVLVTGTYSYSSCHLSDARVDSFYIFYPTGASDEVREFAAAVQSHITKEAGYELAIYPDGSAWADYEILIGNTARTDDELAASLGADEYYIKLTKTEVTYKDGSKHEGAQLVILYGANAMNAALTAFHQQMMPAKKDGGELSFANGYVLTNRR